MFIGLKLTKAYTYLSDVTEHKQVIPYRRFNGGVGRASQAKQFKTTQGASGPSSYLEIQDIDGVPSLPGLCCR